MKLSLLPVSAQTIMGLGQIIVFPLNETDKLNAFLLQKIKSIYRKVRLVNPGNYTY